MPIGSFDSCSMTYQQPQPLDDGSRPIAFRMYEKLASSLSGGGHSAGVAQWRAAKSAGRSPSSIRIKAASAAMSLSRWVSSESRLVIEPRWRDLIATFEDRQSLEQGT